VNSFCEWKTKDRMWHEHILIAFDGAPCFFTWRYDRSNSQFDQQWINLGPRNDRTYSDELEERELSSTGVIIYLMI
jgi:hypothetical protein